ncbi:MAG: hypothetical protein ACI8WB_005210, partial [Phenylobacterium sp.]
QETPNDSNHSDPINAELLLQVIIKALMGGVEYSQIKQVSPDGIGNLALKIAHDLNQLSGVMPDMPPLNDDIRATGD